MQRYQVTIDGREYDVELDVHGGQLDAKINGRHVNLQNRDLGETRSLLFVDNQSFEVDIRVNGTNGGKIVFMKGLEIPAIVEDYNLAQLRKAAGISAGAAVETTIKAPMPGLVVTVKVKEGDKVKKGMPLLVIEAMKMENIVKARGAATVKTVHVTGGQSVEKGDILLEFE